MFSRKNFLLLGMVLGAAVGVAFAPRKGSDFRKELLDEIKKGGMGEKVLKETAMHMGKEIANTAQDVYENPKVQAKIEKTKKEAIRLYEEALRNFEDNKDAWIEKAGEYLENAKDEMTKKMKKED